MDNPHQLHGNHTWDSVINYYRCPACDYIVENRDPFELQLNLLKKDVTCPRCKHSFTVIKKTRSMAKSVVG
jgi:rubredoxin